MHWAWDCLPVGEVITFKDKYKAQSVILSNPRYIFDDVKISLLMVEQYVGAIQYIKNPSEAVQLAAVRKNNDSIQFIKNPSEAISSSPSPHSSKIYS